MKPNIKCVFPSIITKIPSDRIFYASHFIDLLNRNEKLSGLYLVNYSGFIVARYVKKDILLDCSWEGYTSPNYEYKLRHSITDGTLWKPLRKHPEPLQYQKIIDDAIVGYTTDLCQSCVHYYSYQLTKTCNETYVQM